MKTWQFVSLSLVVLLAATLSLPAQESKPVDVAAAPDSSASTENEIAAALECEGDGLIHVVSDSCMHDGGSTASGDSLEVYCYHGIARFCLSGEECTWRGSPAGVREETCSRAGLNDEWMASASCEGWSGFHDFACTDEGQIKLQKEARADIPQSCGAAD